MENKINISELLKDCPKGTKLYSPLVGECTLEHIHGELKKILISTSDGTTLTFNNNGTYFQIDNSECLLFPSKDQRDWSKFQRPFKDGDVIISDYGNIHLLCTKDSSYCAYRPRSGNKLDVTMTTCITVVRLATEEERQKLFDAIKANGYKWNTETKTLEKLIEPKFKVGDRIKYIYFDRKVAKVVKIHDKRYELDNGKFIEFQDENAYEISYDKFDINTLKPFDKVLVRNKSNEVWTANFYSHYDATSDKPFICVGWSEMNEYRYCVPYEVNKHLLNTTNDCDNYYKTW